MGRLAQSTNIFVELYYEWMDDEQAYLDWIDFYKRHVSQPVSSLLELACGTGNISKYLAEGIPKYMATDIDIHMLEQAKVKLPNHVCFMQMDMQNITIVETFDCVLCAADSMNFNQSVQELIKTADGVWEHLSHNGMFVFDVHHPNRLNQYKESYVETGSIQGINYEYILTSAMQSLTHEFYWYVGSYPTTQQYVQRIFSEAEIKQAFPSSKWNLIVENDQGESGFVSGEKWLIAAQAIKLEGEM